MGFAIGQAMVYRGSEMREKINAVQRLFGFYGFVASPLSRREIAHLICPR